MKYLLAIALTTHIAFIGLILWISHAESIPGGWISATILAFTSLPAIYGTWQAWRPAKDARPIAFS